MGEETTDHVGDRSGENSASQAMTVSPSPRPQPELLEEAISLPPA